MFTSTIPLVLLAVLSVSNVNAERHMPLTRRAPSSLKNPEDFKRLRDSTIAKFTTSSSNSGRKTRKKRASSVDIPITDFEFDSTYFATVNIGTPGKQFDVILDTGSSDLWIPSSNCQGCGNAASLSSSSSSSLQTSSQPIDLQYGSGSAFGNLAQDTVSIGGLTVSKQQFVLVDQVSDGLLQGSISGLLGLGFTAIAQTRATPLVEALAQGNQLNQPLMSFYLARQIDNNNAGDNSFGGTFTIGGTNSSLMQGDIDYVNFPSNIPTSFWLVPLTSVTVQGTQLSVQSGTTSLAAIDTGTTLIGGPTSAVRSIYQNIKGSQELTGQQDGYFSIPCNTDVSISFTFSSKTWAISPADFNVQSLGGSQCLGAIFAVDIGQQGGPDWVVGDTFLKNVYSVFRFNPPAIGFASLAANLQDAAATAGAPSGSVSLGNPIPASGTGTSGSPFSTSSSGSSSSGSQSLYSRTGVGLGLSFGFVLAVLGGLFVV